MKYVKTNKMTLVSTEYPSNIIFENRDREFYKHFPAPATFNVPMNSKEYPYINSSAFQILAIWYCRGTTLNFPNNSIKTRMPRDAWHYQFTDYVPRYYIERKATTTQAAYELGTKLIAACTKATQIPFHYLEQAYKDIMKACISNHILAYSPNAKTYLEANSELEVQADLEALYDYDPAVTIPYTDEELNFYARVFDITLPEWFIKNINIKTKHGYAVCPCIDSSGKNSYNSDYAGNLAADGENQSNIPYSLRRDGQPQKIVNTQADRVRLSELITYYLNLPLEDRLEFFAFGYGYCPDCNTYFPLLDGCACGKLPPMDEFEFTQLKEAYKNYEQSST